MWSKTVTSALVLLSLTFSATAADPSNTSGLQFVTGECKSDAACASQCCDFVTGKCAMPIPAHENKHDCGFGDAQSNSKAFDAQKNGQAVQSAQGASGTTLNAATATASGGADSSSSSSSSSSSGTGSDSNSSASSGSSSGADTGANSGAASGTTAATTSNAGLNENNDGSGKGAIGNKKGEQFTTGPCTSDADCAEGCCGFKSGKCAGPVIAQSRDGGCGFGNAQPNADAARKFGFTGQPGQAA